MLLKNTLLWVQEITNISTYFYTHFLHSRQTYDMRTSEATDKCITIMLHVYCYNVCLCIVYSKFSGCFHWVKMLISFSQKCFHGDIYAIATFFYFILFVYSTGISRPISCFKNKCSYDIIHVFMLLFLSVYLYIKAQISEREKKRKKMLWIFNSLILENKLKWNTTTRFINVFFNVLLKFIINHY